MADDIYRELQNALVAYPESGKLIQGSGGLRKIHWGSCWISRLTMMCKPQDPARSATVAAATGDKNGF